MGDSVFFTGNLQGNFFWSKYGCSFGAVLKRMFTAFLFSVFLAVAFLLCGFDSMAAEGDEDGREGEGNAGVVAEARFGDQELSFSDAWNAAVSAGSGSVQLLTDVAGDADGFGIGAGFLHGELYVPSGVSVTLDLNGHTLSRSISEASSGGGILTVQKGGSLTVLGGTIEGGLRTRNGGGIYVAGTCFLQRVYITGCSAKKGGGIYISRTGDLTMEDTVVSGNQAEGGGGVYARGRLTLSGQNQVVDNTGSSFSHNVALVRDSLGCGSIRIAGDVSGSYVGLSSLRDDLCSGSVAGVLISGLTTDVSDCFFGDASGFSLRMVESYLIEVRDSDGSTDCAQYWFSCKSDTDHVVSGSLADMWSLASSVGGGNGEVVVVGNTTASRIYPGDAVTSWGEGYGIDGGHTFVVQKGVGIWFYNRGWKVDRGLLASDVVSVNGRGFLVKGILNFVSNPDGVFTGFYGRESGFMRSLAGSAVELQGMQVFGNGCSNGHGGGFDIGGEVSLRFTGIRVFDNTGQSGAGNLYLRKGYTMGLWSSFDKSSIGLRVEQAADRDSIVVCEDPLKKQLFFSDDPDYVVGYNGETKSIALIGSVDCEYQALDESGKVLESFYGTFDDCWSHVILSEHANDSLWHRVILLTDCTVSGGKKVSGNIRAQIDLNGHTLSLTGSGTGFTVSGVSSVDAGGLEILDSNHRPSVTSEDVGVLDAGQSGVYDFDTYSLTYYTSRLWNDQPNSTKYVRNMSGCGKVLANGMDTLFRVESGYVSLNGGLYVNRNGGPAVLSPNTAWGAKVVLKEGASIMGCGGKSGFENGGGVCVMGGVFFVEPGSVGVAIGGCKGTVRGGAIYLNGDVEGYVRDVIVSGNSAVNGGAVYLNYVATKFDMKGIFSGNQSSANGGAIYNVGSKMNLSYAKLCHNRSGNGGAIFSYQASAVVDIQYDCEFNQNRAVNGGAIAIGWETANCGTFEISSANSSFVFNEAESVGGAICMGGVNTFTKGSVTLQCKNGVSNRAAKGGFLYLNAASEVFLHSVNIHHNYATAYGGGICVDKGVLSAGEVPSNTMLENKLIVQFNGSGKSSSDNLYLGKDAYFGIRDKVVQDSYVGITLGYDYPKDDGFALVGRVLGDKWDKEALMSLVFEYFHSDDLSYFVGVSDTVKSDLVISVKKSTSEDVGDDVEFDGVLVQHYGYVHQVKDRTDGDKNNRIELLDTSGGQLPKNGELYKSRFMYIDPDSGEVLFENVLREIWAEVDTDPASLTQASRMQRSKGVDYVPSEIWVKRPGAKQKSVDPNDWVRYTYSGELWLTSDPGLTGDRYLSLSKGDVVRFVYSSAASKQGILADFYDYDITDGLYYRSEADAKNRVNGVDTKNAQSDVKLGRTIYANTSNLGINSDANYVGSGSRLAFGNSNTGVPHRDDLKPDGLYLNRANRGEYGMCAFELVNPMLGENGLPVGNSGLVLPTLFGEEDAVGKTLYPGHTLEFLRDGNSWLFSGIDGVELANPLTRFNHPSCGTTTYNTIWTNNFWPMDDLSKDNLSGHDVRFGDVTQSGRVRFVGDTYGAFPVSDDGLLHNSYFGMSTEFTFTLTEDYVGPMEYWFLGDDDMWVFLDGKLICDIGGVHSRAGQYVNFWDYIPKGDTGTHTVNLFYTERGASGSTCWMQFILPQIRSEMDAGPVLPETGGIGLYQVYGVGIVLFLGVLFTNVLVFRRCKRRSVGR